MIAHLKMLVLKTAALLLAVLGFAATATAGQLILRNTSNQPITCTVDGWTIASGYNFDWSITVKPGGRHYVGQNATRQGGPVINWASCGNLRTRAMNITPRGPDGALVLNGQQQRVLNVALYSFLPNREDADFTKLVAYVVDTYQQANPQVLLNAQMNPIAQNATGTKIYSFDDLPVLLKQGQPTYGNTSAGGFDVMEIDTLYLAFIASRGLVNQVQITGDAPFPVALAASSWNNRLWGIPSWLCMDFVFSKDPAVHQANTLDALINFLGRSPSEYPQMVGTYNGSWRLPSMYINAYVQAHGYPDIDKARTMPADPDTITNLLRLTNTCLHDNVNKCTDRGYYDSTTPGVTEQDFAKGHAGADMGFSEQSFYILDSPQQPPPLYAQPAAWGDTLQPLLFSDTFVTSSANCPPQSQCAADATAFTTRMTGMAMKNAIVFSQDLLGAPWRRLLVAPQPFYQQPSIVLDKLYQQFQTVFQTAKPFPNDFTQDDQNKMKWGICKALKERNLAYVCDLEPSAAQPGARPDAAPANTEQERSRQLEPAE